MTMTRKQQRELETKAELAMMGKFVPVTDEDEVKFITTYIVRMITPKENARPRDFGEDFDIYSCLHRYNKTNKVTNLGCHCVCGMPCIIYCIDPQGDETPKPFEEDYGTGSPCAFCYVFNVNYHEMCSEFGDCFFKKMPDGYYHRVS